MPWFRHISLSSREATLVTAKRQRFLLDTPVAAVEMVELVTLELQPRTLSIGKDGNVLYFSEEVENGTLTTFRAVLPCGTYQHETLWPALEASMRCAQPVYPIEAAAGSPLNTYAFRPLHGGNRHRLALVSDGRVPYNLHTCRTKLAVQGVALDEATGHLAVHFLSPHPYPLARGAVVDMYHPQVSAVRSRVLGAPEPYGVLVEAMPNLVRRQYLPDDDLWTIVPLSARASIHPMLGFDDQDLASGTKVRLQSLSSPLAATGPTPHQRPLVLATLDPHGCSAGDVVMLINLPGTFLEEAAVTVVDVPSEHHLNAHVDVSPLVQFPAPFTLVVECPPGTTAPPLRIPIANAFVAKTPAPPNVLHVEMEMQAEHETLPEGLCRGAQLRIVGGLGPDCALPSVEWERAVCEVVDVDPRTPPSFTVAFAYPVNRLRVPEHGAPQPHLVRVAAENAVPTTFVGRRKMDFIRNRRVIYLRLWLGMSECAGIVICKNTHDISIFGRAQLRGPPSLETCFLSRADDSAIGSTVFSKCIAKVPFIEVEFVSEDGEALDVGQVGEWSMLLRLGGR